MIREFIKNNKLIHYLYLMIIPYFNSIIVNNKNNKIYKKGLFLNSKLKIKGSNNFLHLKKRSVIRNTKIDIIGNHNKLIISEGTHINNTQLIIQGNYSKIYISKYTTIESSHIASTENNNGILIGKDCMFAQNITLRNGDSHKIFDDSEERINYGKYLIIKDHVWLGEGATVLKGVIIGDNAVIGTKSVITNNVPSRSLAVGFNKIVKRNISWKR